MRLAKPLALLVLSVVLASAWAGEGMVELESPYSVPVTMDRLVQQVEDRGLTVFARIDHAAAAKQVGKALRPTELLIFGNPESGTVFMQCEQAVGIDLPLKALVWEDAQGEVWLGYNDPAFLAKRHGATDCPVVEELKETLKGLADAVVAH